MASFPPLGDQSSQTKAPVSTILLCFKKKTAGGEFSVLNNCQADIGQSSRDQRQNVCLLECMLSNVSLCGIDEWQHQQAATSRQTHHLHALLIHASYNTHALPHIPGLCTSIYISIKPFFYSLEGRSGEEPLKIVASLTSHRLHALLTYALGLHYSLPHQHIPELYHSKPAPCMQYCALPVTVKASFLYAC